MSSGKAFPRLWLGPKARTLENGYTMFAHKESPAKDFEAWIPEKEHSALIEAKDKEITKWKGESELHLTQAMDYQKRFHAQDGEIKRIELLMHDSIARADQDSPITAPLREYFRNKKREALAGGKNES